MRGTSIHFRNRATTAALWLYCLIGFSCDLSAQYPSSASGTPRPTAQGNLEPPMARGGLINGGAFPNAPPNPSQLPNAGAANVLRPGPIARTAQAGGSPSNAAPVANGPAQSLGVQPNQPIPLTQLSADSIGLTAEQIQLRQQAIQSLADGDPLKPALIKLNEDILAELRSRAENERLAREFAASAEAAPAAMLDIKARKENPIHLDQSAMASQLSLQSIESLQAMLQRTQSVLQTISDSRSKIEAAMASRESIRKDLPRQLNDEKAKWQRLTEELAVLQPDNVEPQIRESQRWLLIAKQAASQEKTHKMEQELRLYDAESQLLPLRKELLTAEERTLQAQVKEINDALNKRNEIRIQNEMATAEQRLANISPPLRTRAKKLMDRADEWLQLAKSNSKIQEEMALSKSQKALWSERLKIMTDKVNPKNRKEREIVGFNSWVGLMLRRQRSDLPNPTQLRASLNEYQAQMQKTETLIIDLAVESSRLAQEPDLTGLTIENRRSNLISDESITQQVDELQQAEKSLITSFRVDAEKYFYSLGELAESKQSMIRLVHDYREFVDQQVLWIRSADRMDQTDFSSLGHSFEWMVRLGNWKMVLAHWFRDFQVRPWLWIGAMAAWSLLVLNQSKMRRLIGTLGEQASKNSNVAFWPTFHTLVLSICISAPVPCLLAFLGWRLSYETGGSQFVLAVSLGLLVAGRYYFPLELIRQFCRRQGLAEEHFHWSDRVTSRLRSDLRWLIYIGIPLSALSALMLLSGDEKWENLLGRFFFCSLMLVCGFFVLHVLRPKEGVFSGYLSRHPDGWADRLRYIWYIGLAAAPFLLCILSLIGFHYTSQRLAMLFHTNIITMVGLLFLFALLERWLLLSRRKIMIAQARQRLEESQKRNPMAESTVSTSDSQLDLAEINAQTRRLVSSLIVFAAIVAAAFIWSGVLPAVNVLNAFELWSVQGAKPNELVPITLADLLMAIPIVVMTIVGARNVPGLLEIALLQHLPLENAVRYAISTLSRYAIFMFGVIFTLRSCGVHWVNVQWLVAAFGVGLGFGLQEIFANFVSGIILLFEQPVRVGDVITIGDLTGSVAKIRMRATTITDWDRKELIIPNKDLVTGRLLNWTLSDTTNRIVIPIAIAFGSDADRACQILTDICMANANILRDPPPSAFLEGLGDSAMNLSIRAFLGQLETRLQTRHDLLTAITRRFAQEGIKMPFPQRELHLRTIPDSITNILSYRDRAGTLESDTANHGNPRA